MDIHKPKPFHNLREFLSEIAIVVLGVSIALGAEQAIEWWHWHHKIETIEAAMRTELVDDDLPQSYARLAIEHCLIAQLDSLQALVKPGADGAHFHELAKSYTPPKRTWDNAAQLLAQQSDLSAHMSAERLNAWNTAYAMVPSIRPIADRETDGRFQLLRTRYVDRALTASDADSLHDSIDQLREANRAMAGAGKVLLDNAERYLGLTISKDVEAKILENSREVYGGCVVTPTWAGLPGNDVQVITKEQRKRGFGV
jgi:hypothetical protein